MDDPYTVLGVPRTASAEEIRSAYRRLAKQWHPDTNPDKPEAEARFKAISAAHALLSDPEQRARFDRGEIDASGAERAPPGGGWRDWAEAPQGARYRSRGFSAEDIAGAASVDAEDLEDLLNRAFGEGGGRRRRARPRRGADIEVALRIPFLDAARGAIREVTLPDGRPVRLTIPKGAREGMVLRLAGQGRPGRGEGAPPGDLLALVEIEPHPQFRREGDDILLDLPITLKEAVLGARIEVPTIEGPVTVTVPPYSAEGTRLRLRGRGIEGGHQIVILRLTLPRGPEPDLEAFLRGWTPRDTANPRGTP